MAKKDKSKNDESKAINFGREIALPKSSLKPKVPKSSGNDKKK